MVETARVRRADESELQLNKTLVVGAADAILKQNRAVVCVLKRTFYAQILRLSSHEPVQIALPDLLIPRHDTRFS